MQADTKAIQNRLRGCVADAVGGTDEEAASQRLDELMAAVRRFAKVR